MLFAQAVEPGNDEIVSRKGKDVGVSTPSVLSMERMTNPFLRIDEQAVIEAVDQYVGRQCLDRVERLGVLREWKNQFDRES